MPPQRPGSAPSLDMSHPDGARKAFPAMPSPPVSPRPTPSGQRHNGPIWRPRRSSGSARHASVKPTTSPHWSPFSSPTRARGSTGRSSTSTAAPSCADLMATSTPRKRDGDERRRALCNAAIQVLADHGSRGLTHAQVDRRAGMPDGTTSYYYRTREALLRGVGKRVAEIDVANLQSVSDEPANPDAPFAHLARLTLMQATGDGLALNRARHELLLRAARDPDLADTSGEFVARMNVMARVAIAHL